MKELVPGSGGDTAAGSMADRGWSRLLQLDVSDVEAAHVLVGALEAPRDVLVHGAVIEVQALGCTRGGGPLSVRMPWAPPPEAPQEAPQRTCSSPGPTLHLPHKDFHLRSHPGGPVRTSSSAIVSVGDWEPQWVGGMCSGPSGCQEVLSQSQQGTLLKATCWVSGPSQCSGCLRGPVVLRE